MKIVYTGEKDTRLFKEALGQTIGRLLEEDPDVLYLDADLMSCIGTAKLPGKTDRAIDCGIAEANMVGIACGAASVGFKPIVHSFGPFASRRCYDQVFLSGAYAGNPITVIGSDPGITAAFNGGTHMPFEDMALYRAIPGAVVGAFLIGLSETVIKSSNWSVFSDAFTFALLIIILVVKPTVLFGEKSTDKV